MTAFSVAVLAQTYADHTPRDHDRLHPGLARSHSLILSVNYSARTVLIDPQAASFDDSYDASPYIDGDTISFVQFATKHRFLLRGDTLSYIGYEYRYDQHGNVVYKALPGAGYTQYWYDRAGRLAYMQDANLRSGGLYRFFVYDKAGRQAIQGTCRVCTRDEAVNSATYTGGTNGFMSTGYTLANASRIRQATLETVSYYDDYAFAPVLGSHLVRSGAASAKGLQTGSVVYASDGSRSVSAIYYDVKGQVVENREITNFGTQRVTSNTYTYSGQPQKTTVTEGSVTVVTENTYDAGSGLLTATDVTVNGVRQRVSAVTYDGLGRTASVTRGAALNGGGTVGYSYDLHGRTTCIRGPGLVQNLFYGTESCRESITERSRFI